MEITLLTDARTNTITTTAEVVVAKLQYWASACEYGESTIVELGRGGGGRCPSSGRRKLMRGSLGVL